MPHVIASQARPGTRPSHCAASKQQQGPKSCAPSATAQPARPSPRGPQASAYLLNLFNTALMVLVAGCTDIAGRTVGHLRRTDRRWKGRQ